MIFTLYFILAAANIFQQWGVCVWCWWWWGGGVGGSVTANHPEVTLCGWGAAKIQALINSHWTGHCATWRHTIQHRAGWPDGILYNTELCDLKAYYTTQSWATWRHTIQHKAGRPEDIQYNTELGDLKAYYTTESWATWWHTILFYMAHTKLWFQTLHMCTMLNV